MDMSVHLFNCHVYKKSPTYQQAFEEEINQSLQSPLFGYELCLVTETRLSTKTVTMLHPSEVQIPARQPLLCYLETEVW